MVMELLAAGLVLGALGFAPPEEYLKGETSVPLTYVIDYRADADRDPQFLEAIGRAPPNLLHLGHLVPLNSIFGPTGDYSGFNPELVAPDAILARREELKAFVDRLHRAGVDKVIPYINPSILGGDHEKRSGFWAFYDSWEQYAGPLGLGDKPSRPPETWMQRARRSFDPWAPEPDYAHFRYEPCINERSWWEFQEAVVRLIAASGYDGVFVDDLIMACHNDRCQRFFPGFLYSRFSRRKIPSLFGRDLSLGVGRRDEQPERQRVLRDAETYRFWQESTGDFLIRMNRAGQQTDPDFFTLPNWGAASRVRGAAGRVRSGKSAVAWSRATSIQMFEESHPAGNFGPSGVVDYLLLYKYALALGVRPALLTYARGAAQTELGYAEAAAGGGGAFVQTGPGYPEIRGKWRAFFEGNADLFEGFRLSAPVGLVLAYDEARYGNDQHLLEAFAAARELARLHVPFRAVPKEDLTISGLADLEILLLPDVRYLSEQHLASIHAFVTDGGGMISTGRTGAYDMAAIAHEDSPLKELGLGEGPLEPTEARRGRGTVAHAESLARLVSSHEFDVVRALDLLDAAEFERRMRELGGVGRAAEPPSRLYDWIAQMMGREPAMARGESNLRIVAYERLGVTEGLMTIHAVRYDAPIWEGENGSTTPGPLPLDLTVTLPEGWKVEHLRLVRPGERERRIDADLDGRTVRCRIPPFGQYSMLVLALKRSGRIFNFPE